MITGEVQTKAWYDFTSIVDWILFAANVILYLPLLIASQTMFVGSTNFYLLADGNYAYTQTWNPFVTMLSLSLVPSLVIHFTFIHLNRPSWHRFLFFIDEPILMAPVFFMISVLCGQTDIAAACMSSLVGSSSLLLLATGNFFYFKLANTKQPRSPGGVTLFLLAIFLFIFYWSFALLYFYTSDLRLSNGRNALLFVSFVCHAIYFVHSTYASYTDKTKDIWFIRDDNNIMQARNYFIASRFLLYSFKLVVFIGYLIVSVQ